MQQISQNILFLKKKKASLSCKIQCIPIATGMGHLGGLLGKCLRDFCGKGAVLCEGGIVVENYGLNWKPGFFGFCRKMECLCAYAKCTSFHFVMGG